MPFMLKSIPAYALVLVFATTAVAQSSREIISEATVSQFGLHRAWYTRAQASPGVGAVESIVLDGSLLLVQTRMGRLQAIDAETGRTLWTTSIGKISQPSMPPAANSDFVAMTNGTTLYVLRRATGEVIWQVRLGSSPSAGCAVGPTHVFVPLVNGKVEAFLLKRTNPVEAAAILHSGYGAAQAAPVIGDSRVYWTTNKGDLYADGFDSPMNRFRFRAGGPISSPPAVWSPRAFVTSQDGFCYAINDTTGALQWHFSAGAPIFTQPAPIRDAVYVTSDRRQLWRLNAETGLAEWATAGITKFLAAGASRVYAVDYVGRLAVLDAKTGNRLGTMSTESLPLTVTNIKTDRVYLGSEAGLIVCLREQELTSPLAYVPNAPEVKPAKPTTKPADAPPTTPTEPAPDNPFGSPFGM